MITSLEKRIDSILEEYSIEELFEFLNIDKTEVFELLITNGFFEIDELDAITPVNGVL